MIYRVRQFFQGVFAYIKKEDKLFIDKYLSKDEQALFFQLRLSEQYHSIQVAYGCLEREPYNKKLIRVALLHDVGKIGSNLNLINKSLVVLILRFNINQTILPVFLKKAIDYKAQHAEAGYRLLTYYNTDSYELLLIRNHHLFNKDQTKEMEILQYYDNKF